MLYKIFLSMVILLITVSPTAAVWPFKKGVDKEKIRVQEIKKEIKEVKKNPEIYFGEAFAEVKKFDGDLWKTTEEARKRARQQLNEYIKIRVDTSLRQVLSMGKDGYKKEIEDITELYADKVLEEIEYQDYPDYPKKGLVTVIAVVSKEKYKQTVLKELENKKAKIITHLRAGLKAYKSKLITQALHNFIQAQMWYEEFFHQVPLNMDIDNDGKTEELGALIDVYLSSMLKSIKFSRGEKRYTYGLDGRIIKKPQISVYFEEEEKEIPVSRLPLTAKFVRGEGNISDLKLITGDYGEAVIPVDYINSEMGEAVIQIDIDLKLSNMVAPFYRINLEKRKGAVYSVVFIREGEVSRPTSIRDSLKSLLSRYGYDMEEIRASKSEPSELDIENAVQTNADYYIFVSIKSIGGKQVADYDMYKTQVKSKISVFNLTENRLLSSVEGPSAEGFGSSKDAAASNGLEKIKTELIALLEEEIKKW
ncbi:MAG: hypothetical protein ABIJ15_00310 [bacterium]